MTFIREHGLVRYTPHLGLKKLHSGQSCEGCARPGTGRGLDHCHIHGWVRGVLCDGCNHRMKAIDARKADPYHPPALLAYWRNCPNCAEGGPWTPGTSPSSRPYGGNKFSVYLSDKTHAAWKASGLPLSEIIRRGLGAGVPVDEPALRRMMGEIIREELAGLPVADGRAPSRYAAGDYEAEPYLQDP